MGLSGVGGDQERIHCLAFPVTEETKKEYIVAVSGQHDQSLTRWGNPSVSPENKHATEHEENWYIPEYCAS